MIMAILLLLHEPPKDEPAQQHDVANGFSNLSDGRPVGGCSPIVFVVGAGRPKKSPSLAEGLVFYVKICYSGVYAIVSGLHPRPRPLDIESISVAPFLRGYGVGLVWFPRIAAELNLEPMLASIILSVSRSILSVFKIGVSTSRPSFSSSRRVREAEDKRA
jgi:hypothetical protein